MARKRGSRLAKRGSGSKARKIASPQMIPGPEMIASPLRMEKYELTNLDYGFKVDLKLHYPQLVFGS